jgi:hypothetical protein
MTMLVQQVYASEQWIPNWDWGSYVPDDYDDSLGQCGQNAVAIIVNYNAGGKVLTRVEVCKYLNNYGATSFWDMTRALDHFSSIFLEGQYKAHFDVFYSDLVVREIDNRRPVMYLQSDSGRNHDSVIVAYRLEWRTFSFVLYDEGWVTAVLGSGIIVYRP